MAIAEKWLESPRPKFVKFTPPKSGDLPHIPNQIIQVAEGFEIKIWHCITTKLKKRNQVHIMQFGVNGRRIEVYFYKSGRVAYVGAVPAQKKVRVK